MDPLPQYCPTARELDDLELLLSGALHPIRGFGEPGSPVTLTLPPDVAAVAGGAVELVDPEGLPLARVAGDGTVQAMTHPEHGPFRRLYLTPAQVRERYAGHALVPVTGPLTQAQSEQVAARGPAVLLALVGTGTPQLSPVALLRACLETAGPGIEVVACPLASHDDPAVDRLLLERVLAAYATGGPLIELAADPGGRLAPEVAEIVAFDQPPAHRQGLVLFFTGLSGSGKSTLAQALIDRLLEQGTRTVTSLDGDVVRRHLSAGLTFSKADRETNIARIGWVAAEIARHGGVAVCSPIAPFDQTRRLVRSMVEAAGGAFFLIHVATPLAECERRDRKGLYARARRGEIPEFTGISSPYEEPTDAAVRVDTTGRSIPEALDEVLEALAATGQLDLPRTATDPVAATTKAPLRVLFVCTANICRSPYLEIRARQLLDTEIEFASAGTHRFPDREMDPVMAARLTGAEDQVAAFRSRPLTPELLAEADLVLTAQHHHRDFILEDHPRAVRKVFALGQFAELVAQTPGPGGRELIDRVGQIRGPADPGHDITDPYGRGPDQAAAAAERMDRFLGVAISALARSSS